MYAIIRALGFIRMVPLAEVGASITEFMAALDYETSDFQVGVYRDEDDALDHMSEEEFEMHVAHFRELV